MINCLSELEEGSQDSIWTNIFTEINGKQSVERLLEGFTLKWSVFYRCDGSLNANL